MASTKGDVYGFGIFLLEMLTGKKPTDPMFHGGVNLHNFSWMALPDRVMDVIDPVIKRMASANDKNDNQMEECLTTLLKIGVECSMPSPQVRPNMNDVLGQLQSVKKIYYKYRWANSGIKNATYYDIEDATREDGTTTETRFLNF